MSFSFLTFKCAVLGLMDDFVRVRPRLFSILLTFNTYVYYFFAFVCIRRNLKYWMDDKHCICEGKK